MVWSVSADEDREFNGATCNRDANAAADEDREFNGATCNRDANAGVLLGLADVLEQPVIAWVTRERYGHVLWDHGAAILGGRVPGRQVVFRPRGSIPQGAVCP